jgi:HK97 family phage prohead protease
VSELLRAAILMRQVDEPSRSIDVVASTNALDSHGTILEQTWDLSRYEQNPVVLWAHNSGLGQAEPPIGYASNVRVETGQLKATVTFVDAAASPLAERVWAGVKQKSIRGLSVGFRSRTSRIEQRDGKDVLVLSDNELFEISFVPVPSNSETLAAMRARALEEAKAPPQHDDLVNHIWQLAAGLPGVPAQTMRQPQPVHAAIAATVTAPMPGSQEKPMLNIIRALNLPEASSEADVVARIAQLNTQARAAEERAMAFETLTTKTGGEAIGTVLGWKDEAARAATLTARNAELEAKARKAEVEEAVDAKIKLAHIPPNEREALVAIGVNNFDVLKGLLAVRNTPLVQLGHGMPQVPQTGDDPLVATDEDRAVAKAFGRTVEDILKQKKEERAEARLAG